MSEHEQIVPLAHVARATFPLANGPFVVDIPIPPVPREIIETQVRVLAIAAFRDSDAAMQSGSMDAIDRMTMEWDVPLDLPRAGED